MAGLTVKKIMPAFIPLLLELFKHFNRDTKHNNDIKKFDKTEEKLSTIENLVVKLEKKSLTNRDELKAVSLRLQIWLAINTALLIAIVVKLFFYF